MFEKRKFSLAWAILKKTLVIQVANVRLRERAEKAEAEAEQLRVQLAGCSVAAQGCHAYGNGADRDDYGWSQAYEDVVNLYSARWGAEERYEALRKELATAHAACASKDNRIDDDTQTINQLRSELSACKKARDILSESI
jgi:hypothetical protein